MLSLSFPVPLPSSRTLPRSEKNKCVSSISYCNTPSKKYLSSIKHNLSSSSAKFTKLLATKANFTEGSQDMETLTPKALPEGLQPELMPKHVALFIDGHRRWAAERGLPFQEGYRAGGKAMREITRLCGQWGIKVLTVFLLSTGNWVRPEEEIDFLLSQCEEEAEPDIEEAKRQGVRGSVIGDRSKLPKSLASLINIAEKTTSENTGLHVVLPLNYSGRYDILQATKRIASKVKDGGLLLEDINEKLFEEELETNCTKFPNPDLLIRTSGRQAISNFMLWQSAYTELYFVNKLFPDFDETDFVEALNSYQQRQRRYGGHKK